MRPSTTLPLSAALPEFGASLPIFWVKELHVILPVALGGAFCMLLSALFVESPLLGPILFLLYPLICSAIVALAFGHDYTYRTVAISFAQPVSRFKIWWTRLALCSALIVPLAVLNLLLLERHLLLALLFREDVTIHIPSYTLVFYSIQRGLIPALSALCLAPWLTMTSRSPMFGTVFSLATPFVVARTLALLYPQDGRSMDFNLPVFYAIFAIGAFCSYYRLITLQCIEGDAIPRSKARTNARGTQLACRTNPIWQLVKKEIALQRLPIGIAALAIAIVFLVSKDNAALVSIVYPAAVIVLVGSITSADERRMGLIPSQVAHPILFGSQWLTKIAVSYATALLFGVILPAGALLIKTDELRTVTLTKALEAAPYICGGTLLILALTIYISSLSESGVRAMLASLFIIVIAFMTVGAVFSAFAEYLWRETHVYLTFSGATEDARLPLATIDLSLELKSFFVASLGFIALALYFAMQNHRFLDRQNLARQVCALILHEVAALSIISFFIA